ncbi:fibulin-2-like [Spinachia spinachia]
MARWTILLFSLCVVLNGEEIEFSTVQRCCQDGRDLAIAGQHCVVTSTISSCDACNITKEQCCSTAVKDALCDKGIEMAEWQGACETPFFQGEPWEIPIAKTCCDCCMLGVMMASQGFNCNFQGFLLLETCLHTAKGCCERSSEAQIEPNEYEMELREVQRCCQRGRDRALLGQDCTNLSFFSSSYSCSITKRQCCSAAVGEWFCNNGVKTAKEKGTCHGLFFQGEHWETQMSKMCCDCCLLGLMIASQNSSCDFQGLSPGRQCLDTAKGCCETYTTDMQPTTNVTQSPQVSSTTQSHEGLDPCRDSHCSQLCKDNGTCACLAGYELQNDGVNCQDIDECAWPAGGHKCSYSCSNVPGSFYCTCPTTGYTLAQNGHTCQDIDECAAGTHTCSLRRGCFNILGGFRCLSLKCPRYFYLAKQGKDTSASWNCFKFCHPRDLGCSHYSIHLIRYISISLPTSRVIRKPKEIAFLQLAPAADNIYRSSGKAVTFNILVGDEFSSFDVIKRSYKGVPIGVLRQLKPLRGPKDFVYQVAVTRVKSGVVSHRSIVIIHFFISKFWF